MHTARVCNTQTSVLRWIYALLTKVHYNNALDLVSWHKPESLHLPRLCHTPLLAPKSFYAHHKEIISDYLSTLLISSSHRLRKEHTHKITRSFSISKIILRKRQGDYLRLFKRYINSSPHPLRIEHTIKNNKYCSVTLNCVNRHESARRHHALTLSCRQGVLATGVQMSRCALGSWRESLSWGDECPREFRMSVWACISKRCASLFWVIMVLRTHVFKRRKAERVRSDEATEMGRHRHNSISFSCLWKHGSCLWLELCQTRCYILDCDTLLWHRQAAWRCLAQAFWAGVQGALCQLQYWLAVQLWSLMLLKCFSDFTPIWKASIHEGVGFLKFVSRHDFFSTTAFRQTKHNIWPVSSTQCSHCHLANQAGATERENASLPKRRAGNPKLDVGWKGSANPVKLGWVAGAGAGPAGATAGRGGRTVSSLRLLSVVVLAVIVFSFTGGGFPKKSEMRFCAIFPPGFYH